MWFDYLCTFPFETIYCFYLLTLKLIIIFSFKFQNGSKNGSKNNISVNITRNTNKNDH